MNQIQSPNVAVVVAAFNSSATILNTISSILSQSTAQLQLLICDDASTDGSPEIVKKIQDPRISLLVNESNLGPGPSRDRAIRYASAPWVALVDADDAWHPDRLRRLMAVAEATNADVVFDDTLLCHDTRTGLAFWKPLHGVAAFGEAGDMPREIRIEDYISSDRLLIHPLIRTDFIRKHAIRHSARRFAEDAEFYLHLALAGAKFCYVPEPLYYYRITPGSLTAQAKDPALMRKCLEECAQWQGWSPAVESAFREKIASLHSNESLHALVKLVRDGRLVAAANLLTSDHRLLKVLPRRILQQFHYRAHKFLHGGRSR